MSRKRKPGSKAAKIRIGPVRRARIREELSLGVERQRIADTVGVSRAVVDFVKTQDRTEIDALREDRMARVRANLERVGLNAVNAYNEVIRQATQPRAQGPDARKDYRAKGDVLRAAVAAADSVLDRIGVKRESSTKVEHSGSVSTVVDLMNTVEAHDHVDPY